MHVELDDSAQAAFRRHALACLPNEACGLLARTRHREAVQLTGFAPIPNSAAAPDRFTMDPLAVLRVATQWRAEGLELGAVFHSHPDGAATPSRVDVTAAALWPDLVQLILHVDSESHRTGACTAWRFEATGLTRIPWLTPATGSPPPKGSPRADDPADSGRMLKETQPT
jgi:proteasome lid subunit RPN8/RPN11